MIFNFAHVKWFVSAQEIIAKEELKFSLFDSVVLSWIAIILLVMVVAFLLEKKLVVPAWLTKFGQKNKKWVFKLFQALIALFLFLTAYDEVLFAPIFEVEGLFLQVLSWLTVLAGILFLVDVYAFFGAIILAGVYVLCTFIFGLSEMLDHVHLVGIAIFIFIVKNLSQNILKKYKKLALPILRVLTGSALMILAFSEKLLHPELGLEFLQVHDWNFVAYLGNFSWFSNYVFVISAGATEFLFGLLFVLGLVTRLNTLAVAAAMSVTAAVLGWHEVLGHLTIFAVGILFLIYGSGEKWKVLKA